MDEAQLSEFAISDNDLLPFKWVRYSRLKHPRGPFYDRWLFEQVIRGNIKSVIILPRGKNHGIRLVNLDSLLELFERLTTQRPEEVV